jgi:hypothetical protein
MVEIFGGKTRGRIVHGFAPGPEGIAAGPSAVFSAGTDGALEGMRMYVDEPREQGAARQPTGSAQVLGRIREARNLALRIGKNRHVTHETAIAIQQVGQTAGFNRRGHKGLFTSTIS